MRQFYITSLALAALFTVFATGSASAEISCKELCNFASGGKGTVCTGNAEVCRPLNKTCVAAMNRTTPCSCCRNAK